MSIFLGNYQRGEQHQHARHNGPPDQPVRLSVCADRQGQNREDPPGRGQ